MSQGQISGFSRSEQARRRYAPTGERQRAQRRVAPPPPVLTGGESSAIDGDGAKVDWLTVTWAPGGGDGVARFVFELLKLWFGDRQGLMGEESPGMLGYSSGCRYFVLRNGSPVSVARVDWGGDQRRGRARLDISGAGCALIEDWALVHELLSGWADLRMTRVDLAVDCLGGEFGVEDARDWYLGGEFHAGGRRPRHSLVGDWLDPRYGRTLEVGRRENGKMLRAYEKGRQLGNADSLWTRFEIELRNIDRVLPLDVLITPGRYFVGAYQALQRLLDVAGQRIATLQAEGEIALGRLVEFHRSAYGQLVHVLRGVLSADQVVDFLVRPGVPSRLRKASLRAFETAGAEALLQELRA